MSPEALCVSCRAIVCEPSKEAVLEEARQHHLKSIKEEKIMFSSPEETTMIHQCRSFIIKGDDGHGFGYALYSHGELRIKSFFGGD